MVLAKEATIVRPLATSALGSFGAPMRHRIYRWRQCHVLRAGEGAIVAAEADVGADERAVVAQTCSIPG